MSQLIVCDVGDVVKIRGALTDEDDQPLTGATVTGMATLNGTEVDLGEATPEGAGIYMVRFEPTTPGRWKIRLESAEPNQAAEPGIVHVRS